MTCLPCKDDYEESERCGVVSFSPAPPPGFYRPNQHSSDQFKDFRNSPSRRTDSVEREFPRRPRTWVPPLIVFGAFAAGYAIPWDLGSDPSQVIARIVFPLTLAAAFCLVAGYYSYRTVPGWRIWTWVAFGSMLLNAIHAILFTALLTPIMVDLLLWLSVVALGVAGSFGAEERSDIHRRPSITMPGNSL